MSGRAQTSRQHSTGDEQAIRSVVDTWLRASERGELPTLLNLMEDDVVFLTPGREPFGKSEFVQGFEQMRGTKLEAVSDIQEVQVMNEWAWLRNYLQITMTPERGKTITRSGHILSILHKGADGQWRFSRDANLLMGEN